MRLFINVPSDGIVFHAMKGQRRNSSSALCQHLYEGPSDEESDEELTANIHACVLHDCLQCCPTFFHEWMFLVLEVLGVPMALRSIILALYTCISAYASGIGRGSFLFWALGDVRAGCPLSSMLFILCTNLFLQLLQLLSGRLGNVITSLCADDFGPAPKTSKRLRTDPISDSQCGLPCGLAEAWTE